MVLQFRGDPIPVKVIFQSSRLFPSRSSAYIYRNIYALYRSVLSTKSIPDLLEILPVAGRKMIADKVFQDLDSILFHLIGTTDFAGGGFSFLPRRRAIDPKHFADQKQFGEILFPAIFAGYCTTTTARNRVDELFQTRKALLVLLQALDDELESLGQRDLASIDGEQIFEQSVHGRERQFGDDIGAVDKGMNAGVPSDGDVVQRAEGRRRRVAISANLGRLERRGKIPVVLIVEERHRQQRSSAGA